MIDGHVVGAKVVASHSMPRISCPMRGRQQQHGGGEDDGDDAGHVHAQRHVGRLADGGARRRRAYWIGIRRWPSLMKTTARITPSTTIGSDSFSNTPPLSHAEMAVGIEVRIEQKISSDWPLPTPRRVM